MKHLIAFAVATLATSACIDAPPQTTPATDDEAQELVATPPIGPATNPATTLTAYASTADGVSIQWTEHGGNAITILQRQTYDLAGNPAGYVEVSRWLNAAANTYSYYDKSTAPYVIGKTAGLTAGGTIPTTKLVIPPDTQVDYRIVEMPAGITTCTGTIRGTCSYTATTAFMPKNTKYGVGRIQLRLATTTSTANANNANLRVRAKLRNYNETWLDSTHDDFRPGTLLTYDLSTAYVGGLQDLEFLDLWTPDPDGICVGGATLLVNNYPVFDQQFSTCQWVQAGSALHIPFATIRSSSLWQTFRQDTFGSHTPPITWVGYDAAGMVAYLDGIAGSKLKNAYGDAGIHARIAYPATLTRLNASHLKVVQHFTGISTTGSDTIDANPSYTLTIHYADSFCAGWCVSVDDFEGNAGSWDNLGSWVVDHLNPFEYLIRDAVNDALAKGFQSINQNLQAPDSYTYCFPPAAGQVDHDNPGPVIGRSNEGTIYTWPVGSLTVCGPYRPQSY